jgi:hypothetical protein
MFALDWSDPQTLWLNLTNLALGVVTLLAVLVVGGAVGQELWARRRKAREAEDAASPHVFAVPELGLTMADGGEPLPPASEKEQSRKRSGR